MSYPKISDDDFQERINNKFAKYTIPKKRKTFNQICYPKEVELQEPQKFLAKYINPASPYKGILVYHGIGSGKTMTGITIGEAFKHTKRIVVVLPASLKGNFRNELRSKMTGNAYLTNTERDKLAGLHPSNDEYKEIIKKSDERINKYYDIYSYNKFVDLCNLGKMQLRSSILIVDEVQNMVSETGIYYETLYDTINNAPKELRVVLLSATPMYNAATEIPLTMNLLRLPFEFPTGADFEREFISKKFNKRLNEYIYSAKNLDIFKERIRGYVSFYRGAPPYVYPETILKYVRCEMSDFQYKSYVSVLVAEEKETKFTKMKRRTREFDTGYLYRLPNNFFIGTRLVSNIAFPNKDINEKGFKSLTGRYLKLENLKKYSIKFYKIMKRINAASGPVVVYSEFKNYGGLASFERVLQAEGFRHYSDYGEGPKRYAKWTGDEKMITREEVKAVFNQETNTNGSKLKVLLLSSAGKEGLSLLSVRQIHLIDNLWNMSKIEQVIGRGIRFCSHRRLPEEKRNVKVYIYLAVHEKEEETIDEYIMTLAQKKNKLIKEFEKAMKESAIDCKLFYNANVYKEENDPITCDI